MQLYIIASGTLVMKSKSWDIQIHIGVVVRQIGEA